MDVTAMGSVLTILDCLAISYRYDLCGIVAPRTGFEPVTSSVTGWCSNHLNYRSIYGGNDCTYQPLVRSNPYPYQTHIGVISTRFDTTTSPRYAGAVMAIWLASSSMCCLLPITESMGPKRCSSCLRVSQVLWRPVQLVLRCCRVLAAEVGLEPTACGLTVRRSTD